MVVVGLLMQSLLAGKRYERMWVVVLFDIVVLYMVFFYYICKRKKNERLLVTGKRKP